MVLTFLEDVQAIQSILFFHHGKLPQENDRKSKFIPQIFVEHYLLGARDLIAGQNIQKALH